MALGILREPSQRLVDFDSREAAKKGDGAYLVAIERLRQAAQQRLRSVGGHTVDDELTPGDAERELRAIIEQMRDVRDQRCDRRLERGMTHRVHPVLVQCDGKLDQELARGWRQRGAIGAWGDAQPCGE
jgi:hypothetical protein